MSDKTIRGSINDTEGHKVGEYANHSYEVKSDKEALSLMNFMDKNTNVEWGNTLMKDMQGNFINLLSTSHDVNTIKVGSFQVNKYIRRGFRLSEQTIFILHREQKLLREIKVMLKI